MQQHAVRTCDKAFLFIAEPDIQQGLTGPASVSSSAPSSMNSASSNMNSASSNRVLIRVLVGLQSIRVPP